MPSSKAFAKLFAVVLLFVFCLTMNPLIYALSLLAYFAPSLLPPTTPNAFQTLTILPLGDSITWGYDSPDGNGYRLRLSQLLLSAGLPPYYNAIPGQQRGIGHRFVGSLASGTMPSNRNEGHNGFTISQLLDATRPVLHSYCGAAEGKGGAGQRPWDRPDVILLMAGTNDLVLNPLHQDATKAPARLAMLLRMVVRTCPRAAVVVAKIVGTNDSMPAGVPGGEERVKIFNEHMHGIVERFVGNGGNVSMVDMQAVVGGGDTVDGVHPNGDAYRRMGDVWFEGMKERLPLLDGATSTG